MRGREKERECESYKDVRIDEERNKAEFNTVNEEDTEKQLQLLKSLPSLKRNFAL